MTSTKPWLDGYETVKQNFKSIGRSVSKTPRMNSTMGQAMFNVKRTLDHSDSKADANQYIRRHNPFASTKQISLGKSSVKKLSGFYSSR